MEPFEDKELNTMLREWQAPPAPARLRDAIFPRSDAPWWRRIWRAQIRIPVPLAVCLVLLLIGWWLKPALPPPPQSAQAVTFRELQPVKELKIRIIRRRHEQN